RAPSFSLVFSGDRVSAWGWGARRSRPRRSDSGSGLEVDLFALGATRSHVVTEMRPERRPGLACGDAHFARRLRAAPQVLGNLTGSPSDHHTGLVITHRGNGTQTLFQVIAGELEFNSQDLASVAERHDVAPHIGRAVELDVGQIGNEFLQARSVGTGLSHRCPFRLVG